MNDAPSLPRKLMLLIAAGQGIALLLLYKAHEFGTWPSESPPLSYPLWTLAFAVPVLLLLSLESGNSARVAKFVGVFALVLALAAVYIGSQARPFDEFPLESLTGIFACTMALASFKALMYLQQRAARQPMTYDVLFTNSWRNFLTLGLALLFTLVFWLILRLWAELFQVIGIDFFDSLFEMEWFLFPALGLAHGIGVIMFRNLTRVIDSITRLLQGLIKLLLPLVLLIAVAFIFSLPFVGLDSLWSTGYGTAMLLWLLALILFFTNAVYQDGRGESPYPLAIHRTLFVCLFVMPFIAALSYYGLSLRVEQYGLSVERCWAFVVWLILTLFTIGYIVGVLRKRDQWTEDLARVNTGMGLVVLGILLLANSPVLDFRKISLASQLARVDAGEIELEDFDFWYAHSRLARPGYLALEEMKEQVAETDPELLAKIENPTRYRYRARPEDDWWEEVIYRPGGFEVPDGLREKIETATQVYNRDVAPVLIRTDLDGDGQHEYVFVLLYLQENKTDVKSYFRSDAKVFIRTPDGWTYVTVGLVDERDRRSRTTDTIEKGEIVLEQPRFKNLRIGDIVVRTGEIVKAQFPAADPVTGVK